MKTAKYLLVMLLAIILVTGCGSSEEKTLTCTNKEELSGLEMEQTITMTFKDDKISYVKMDINEKATSSEMKDIWESVVETLDEGMKELKESDGIKISGKNNKDDYSYLMTYEIDLKKAKKDSLEELGMENILNSNDGLEDVKKDAEADGYTCK